MKNGSTSLENYDCATWNKYMAERAKKLLALEADAWRMAADRAVNTEIERINAEIQKISVK